MNLWTNIPICPRCSADLERINDDVGYFQLAQLLGMILGGIAGAFVAFITFKLLGEIVGLALIFLVTHCIGVQTCRYWCASCKRVIDRTDAIETSQSNALEQRMRRAPWLQPKQKKHNRRNEPGTVF